MFAKNLLLIGVVAISICANQTAWAKNKKKPNNITESFLYQSRETGDQTIRITYLRKDKKLTENKGMVLEIPVTALLNGEKHLEKTGWLIISDLRDQKLSELLGDFTYETSVGLGWLPTPVDLNSIFIFQNDNTRISYNSAVESLSLGESWKSRVKRLKFTLRISLAEGATCHISSIVKVKKEKQPRLVNESSVLCSDLINKSAEEIFSSLP